MDPTHERVAHPEASAPPQRDRREPIRAALVWGLGLVVTLAACASAAAIGLVAATFGLGALVLVVVGVVIAVGATIWRRGMLPLASVAVALALPAAWAASEPQQLDRSRGALIVAPRSPAEVARDTYRRGVGPVLIDLRRFRAPANSTTRIAARADAGQVVVALPRDRCFHLDVRYRLNALNAPSSLALVTARAFTGGRGGEVVSTSGLGLTTLASQRDSLTAERAYQEGPSVTSASPYDLLAFNRWAAHPGQYRRDAAGDPSAPTLRLDLSSSQQMVIRDYPREVGPLNADDWSEGPNAQVGGMHWPEGLRSPLAPVEVSWARRAEIRTPRNRARWIAWEHDMIAWARAQARRAAGPCASKNDLEARGFWFLTQPERLLRNGRSTQLAGGYWRRSVIEQRPVRHANDMVRVEVNGLGATRTLGVVPRAGDGLVGVSPGVTP